MIVQVKNAALTNCWQESFKDRETGELINFSRALISVVGEPPAQVAVRNDDFERLSSLIGTVGTASLEIDARPGSRVRVYLQDVK